MSEVAIHADALSKRYRIGSRERYYTLRDTVAGVVSAPFRRLLGNGQMSALNSSSQSAMRGSQSEFIWALKDVSFEVKQGEVVGMVGRNGAGKSTLLKILSRITEPSEGEVRIYGRVGSLLEVGTGFHPELSGRENIYLNGAILGMREREIDHKFDEIVAFAEVEKFLDTPVKRYSSGMYMRLAFAVAAHLETEILLVDEVLAVGDLAFQRKCMGRIGDVAQQGRTVIFVSHNMRAIRQLCGRVLWLDNGELKGDSNAEKTIGKYLQNISWSHESADLSSLIRRLPPDPAFRLESVTLRQNGMPVAGVENGQPLEVAIGYQVLQKIAGLRVFFDLYDRDGTLLFRSFHDEQNDGVPVMEPGKFLSAATIPENLLAPTHYTIHVLATVYNVRMCIPFPGIRISVDVEATGSANRAYPGEPIRGKLAPVIPWITEALSGDPAKADLLESGHQHQ